VVVCSADDVYKLWRIFNAVAETTDDSEVDEADVPASVHPDEVELLVQRLGVALRTPATYTSAGQSSSSFAEFLRTIETSCLTGKHPSVVSSAVGELYDDIIVNVLKKVSNNPIATVLLSLAPKRGCLFYSCHLLIFFISQANMYPHSLESSQF